MVGGISLIWAIPIKMMYAGVDIIDRNPPPPPPGVVPISGTFRSGPGRMQARLTKRVSEYPSPHSGRPIVRWTRKTGQLVKWESCS